MKIPFIRLSVFWVLMCLFFSCSSDDNPKVIEPVPEKMDYTFNSEELEAMALINSYRQSIGLIVLKQNKHISYIAQEHNLYMIEKNIVSHNGFDERFDNIVKVLGAIKVGENIAYNYKSPKGALDAWLLSPSHKKIIEGDYTELGLSIRRSETGRIYYTNIFAKIIEK